MGRYPSIFRTYKSLSRAERDKGPKSSSGSVYLVKSLENMRSLPVVGDDWIDKDKKEGGVLEGGLRVGWRVLEDVLGCV